MMDGRQEAYWMGVGSMLDDAIDLLKQVREADKFGYRPSEVTEHALPLGSIAEPLDDRIKQLIELHESD